MTDTCPENETEQLRAENKRLAGELEAARQEAVGMRAAIENARIELMSISSDDTSEYMYVYVQEAVNILVEAAAGTGDEHG